MPSTDERRVRFGALFRSDNHNRLARNTLLIAELAEQGTIMPDAYRSMLDETNAGSRTSSFS
ncbi:tyrosine-protein phosphatase [Amycolatopsis sp. TNS106]|uniref:tyrosine-protein phosphatase n=1 Tax=Amycolatopsis sp. TNS106 TaxID=2861750 RepID=UPI0021073EE9|nr:tyrosine-protein phosphatase [Amycolatopsis sp. TNS106]